MVVPPMTQMGPVLDPFRLKSSVWILNKLFRIPNVGDWTPYVHPEGALYFFHSNTVLLLRPSTAPYAYPGTAHLHGHEHVQ
jgi:hypothetical protein